ncbi:MAG: FliI/YscN family ATPase [Bacteriovoracales bacterium]|nr:FliI/YscN family ATPase [Bacteriovoracales bacterium]
MMISDDKLKKSQSLNFDPLYKAFDHTTPYLKIGKIISSNGSIFKANLPMAKIGNIVRLLTSLGESTLGEVIGISGNECLIVPYSDISGVNSQTLVYLGEEESEAKISENLLGRIIDFQGNPIDGKGPIRGPYEYRSIFGESINPLERPPIREKLNTGINALNCFLTPGKGQRFAIMAGSGVGKSVLLGMIARNAMADINVIALIGERGREVLEFIESDLGPEGLKKSIIVVATSEKSPLIKMRATYLATTIAEHFRDRGNDVIYMMDSITRFAMAYREVSLSAGEPPGQRGYPPSAFSRLSKILERAGTKNGKGTITGFYAVLVEGGDMDEPITDAIRGIADGHIVLSRELAARGHYPAIDILQSVSRVMNRVVSKEHRIVAQHLQSLFAIYRENEDLIKIGAYVKGTNEKIDKAISIYDDMIELLKQRIDYSKDPDDLYDQMVEMARKAESIDMNHNEV